MNLYRLLQKRAVAGRPVRVGLIGAGKFGSMFLSQVPTTPGLEIAAIADLSPDRARAACRGVGWTEERVASVRIVDDAMAMIASPDVEVVVEATGHAPAGIAHARRAIREGTHMVMVNVEADVRRVASAQDDMRAIFSYDLILDAIRLIVARGHEQFVETFAEEVAAATLRHPRVVKVKVRVEKLDVVAGAVGVEIHRERSQAKSATVEAFARPSLKNGA